MSASGYMIFSGTHAPWSRPRLRCSCTGSVSGMSLATCWASSVAAGVSYRIW